MVTRLTFFSSQGTRAAAEQQSETSTISISMPPTPSSKGVGFNEIYSQTSTPRGTTTTQNKRISSYSQASTPRGTAFPESPKLPRSNTNKLKDARFDSFKTWSGRLERQLSLLRGKEQEPASQPSPRIEIIPVDRYFDALEGPELDTLRVYLLSLVTLVHPTYLQFKTTKLNKKVGPFYIFLV